MQILKMEAAALKQQSPEQNRSGFFYCQKNGAIKKNEKNIRSFDVFLLEKNIVCDILIWKFYHKEGTACAPQQAQLYTEYRFRR